MALDALAGMLTRDWNGIIWKEGCNDPATAMIGAYDKSKQSRKDDGVDLSTGYNAVYFTLRLDDLLGACAAKMGNSSVRLQCLSPAMTMGGMETPSSLS
jgi:hypothetical protein